MSRVPAHRSAKTKQWIKRQIPTVATGIGFLLLWELVARVIGNNRIFATIPYTLKQTLERSDTVVVRVMETFTSVFVAFILAVCLGVVLGMVVAELYTIRQMTMPLIIFAYAVPHPVLAPMFIIWFLIGGDITLLTFQNPAAYVLGSEMVRESTLSLAIDGVSTFGAWVGFFPVFLSTITGMNALEERFQHLGAVLGASRWQMVKYFRFWRAMPNITSSIKSTVQLSIVGVIVAEFIASSSGIGYQIVLAWKNAALGYMFGVVIVIMLGSYLFYQIAVWTLKAVTPPGSV
ncbi:ABC transporter permease subunit [Halorarum halophilum]|uniref:ABC transporter permease subunit n=1 Tax=Halorarum halophilum TaxID=2743090 RepID=A0A7D5KHA0_9EURY|nr:ABC transporter permease subunit [Halobaculum halophilum]QLG28976.1 ABC transporter permease subunit [Halobaculum halophilum]